MKRISFFIVFFILSSLSAQKQYNQQKADYNIDFKLNPLNNSIEGYEEITYKNNSDKTLNELYLYLYANEYKSNDTQLAKELFRAGNTGLYFAKKNEFGGYSSISIASESHSLKWDYTNNSKTIIRVLPDSPILPNQNIKIEINFNIDLPKDINGFGYSNNQYNMTNCYPKMLTYSEQGWNNKTESTISLLSSDFGDYKVKIKVPENYIIAATGRLETVDEIDFIKNNIINKSGQGSKQKNTILPIEKNKTLEFASLNTTAFAWFANPKFNIRQNKIKLENGSSLDLFLYFDNSLVRRHKGKKINVIFNNAEKAIRFYSKAIGNLTQNQISIVATTNINGNNSYSTLLTAQTKKRQRINRYWLRNLTHNIGKLWIDNHIACDEYESPWIKNGLTGYFHNRYMLENTSSHQDNSLLNKAISILSHSSVRYPADNNKDFYKTKKEIFLFTFFKPAISYNYLRNYLGDKKFTDLMRAFFKDNKYKQITGLDIQKHFEQFTNKDLKWFFDGLIGAPDPFKYQIDKLERSESEYILDIKNGSNFKIPLQIGGIKKGKVKNSKFIKGFVNKNSVHFPKGDYDKIMIDPNHLYYKSTNLKEKINTNKSLLSFIGLNKNLIETPKILPVVGYNAHDGIMAGFNLHRFNLQYLYNLSLLYGIRSKSVVGYINYKKILNSPFNTNKMEAGIDARRFHRQYNKEKGFNLKYLRITPYLNINLGDNEFDTKSKIRYRFSFIRDETLSREGVETYNRYINNIDYTHNGGNVITPFGIEVGLEHQYYNYYEKRQYLMVHSTINSSYMYKKNRLLSIRLYGATYLYNTNKNSTGTYPGTLSLIGAGNNDYGYNHFFIDRSAQDGFWSRQLMTNTGGFKTAIGSSYGIGQSNNYVVSANIKMDLPFGTFIKPYLDLGIYGDLPTVSEGYSNKFIYSSGLIFQIIKDKIEIYLPVLNSKEIENIYKEKGGKILDRISFMVNFSFD